jgi:hypothetical protein
MKVYECEQYSDEWWRVRRGVPTASEFGNILTPKTAQLAAAHTGYIYRLIGDTFDLNYPRKDDVATAAMRHGTLMEPEARRWYEFETAQPVRQVGFCTTDDGAFGCSPDGLVGEDGGLELKNPAPQTHVRYLFEGNLPAEYRCQVHGQLIVTGRAWWDFVSYCPGLPPFLFRVFPDDFTDKLRAALAEFDMSYRSMLAVVRAQLDQPKEAA